MDEHPARWWRRLRTRLTEVHHHRSIVLEANDGIVATAGLLQGFAGAGASNRALLVSAAAATISGGVGVGAAAWAEDAAEREAQLVLAEAEAQELAEDLPGEIEELADRWESKGLEPDLAREVAEQLTAEDPLAAQLESEYGFTEPMPAGLPMWSGIVTTLAYAVGAAIPFAITVLAPVDVETWAILGAVVVALVITTVWATRSGRYRPRTMLARTLVVGGCTMAAGYVAGELLL